MDINAHLDNLRSKPEHIRRRYAFWTSLGITAVIFAFWAASFTAIGDTSKSAVASVVDKAQSPAQSMTASVGSFFADIKDILFGPRRVTYTNIQVAPGNK